MEIRTDRLVLRSWREEDRQPFAAMNADPVVMEYFPAPLTPVESDAFADRIERHLNDRGYGLWAVEILGAAPFIGFVGLADVPADLPPAPGVEIGWRLAREHWGCGYATEAARAALHFAFKSLELVEVVSFTSATNKRSRRVMERLGMSRDRSGDFDHPRLPPGNPLRPHVLYRLARDPETLR
jgi:RimJ/RimL family protein N-acetyltransferase